MTEQAPLPLWKKVHVRNDGARGFFSLVGAHLSAGPRGVKTPSSLDGVLVRCSCPRRIPALPPLAGLQRFPGKCLDSAGQMFPTQIISDPDDVLRGNGGQPRRETGASGEPAEGALHPPAPLLLGGVPDSPRSGSGMSLCRVTGLPAVSRELPQLALTWALPHLSAGHVASPTPGSRSGCLWDTPCRTPPPRGIPGWWLYLPCSATGLLAGHAPPTVAPAPGVRGTWVVRLLWAHCVGRAMAPTPMPVVVSRGIPPDFSSDVCCKHTSPGGCAWAWGLSFSHTPECHVAF